MALRYLVQRRRQTSHVENTEIPIETLREALITYLTPFDPRHKDITDIDMTGTLERDKFIELKIYYKKGAQSKTKKD